MGRLLALLFTALGLLGATPELQVVTYAQTPGQVRKAALLVASLRARGGPWRLAPVHVVATEELDLNPLRTPGVQVHISDAPPRARAVPYAIKAWAAAQVEAALGRADVTLAWLDPETLVVAPPRALCLALGQDVKVQPVFKGNAVALPAAAPADPFWTRVLAPAGLGADRLPLVQTRVEGASIRAYYNAEVFSVRPSRRILQGWRDHLDVLLQDSEGLSATCPTPAHRIFLHQAALSAHLATLPSDRMAPLPLAAAYPINLQADLPVEVRTPTLAGLEVLILEDVWDQDPGWWRALACPPDLEAHLRRWGQDYHALGPGVWREERREGCNSLLVRTSRGDVLVDGGGTLHPRSAIWELHQGHRLAAVLLTHGHADHLAGLDRWLKDRAVPVHGHRRHRSWLDAQARIAPLQEQRNARLQDRPVRPVTPLPPRVTHPFDRSRRLRFGDTTFELIHAGGETPDTALVWVPERRLLCMADLVHHAFPALATPRGTPPRPVRDYLRALDLALELRPEFLVPGHGEPWVGWERIAPALRRRRDALAFVLEATLAGLNEGRSVEDLARTIRLPEALTLPESFGRVAWAVRAIALEHVGPCSPRLPELFETPASAIHPLLVDAVGGPERVADLARRQLEAGAPQEALRLLELIPDQALSLRLKVVEVLLGQSRNHFQQAFLAAERRRLLSAGGAGLRRPPGAPGPRP